MSNWTLVHYKWSSLHSKRYLSVYAALALTSPNPCRQGSGHSCTRSCTEGKDGLQPRKPCSLMSKMQVNQDGEYQRNVLKAGSQERLQVQCSSLPVVKFFTLKKKIIRRLTEVSKIKSKMSVLELCLSSLASPVCETGNEPKSFLCPNNRPTWAMHPC